MVSREPQLARLLNHVAAFNYVTVEGTPTYRSIVQVLYDAKQHYVIELRPDDILVRIRAAGYHTEVESIERLAYYLERLVEWGNLEPRVDTTAASRIEDFYRNRQIFHLSTIGEAAHTAVLHVEATVGASGSLQTSMLVKIRDALYALAQPDSVEASRTVRLLHDLHAAFTTLAEEANRFIGDLGRHTAIERLDEERFVLHKQALLVYISRFVETLRQIAPDIAAAVETIENGGFAPLLAAAVAAAELPPALDDTDPGERWIAEQQARWNGVRGWFVGDGDTAVVERLASVAVDAVVRLVRMLGRLNERRTRTLDRAADFRQLARWFAAVASDDDAHRLWQVAFGLHSARHFHIADADAERFAPSTSWWEAPPIEVPVRLRTHGQVSNAGRPAPAADHSLQKEWIAQQQRKERQQIEAALRRFAGRERLALGDLATLETAEFELLLALLDEALCAPPMPNGSRRTRTADGRLLVTLVPPGNLDLVTIETPRGRLRVPNYRISVMEARVPIPAARDAAE